MPPTPRSASAVIRTDVLVVGAGPAGSACATLLAGDGIGVTVVDRAEFPRDKPCSEYMSPEAVRILDGLGVLGDLEAAGGHQLAGTTVIGPRGARMTGWFQPDPDGPAVRPYRPYRATGLSIARRILDARLVERAEAAGAAVLQRTTVEQLVYDRGAVAGAVVRGAQGERTLIRARLTVGADGLRSVVARRLGPVRRSPPSRLGFVAHVAGVSGLGATAEMHVSDAGYVGLNPIGGGVANVALVVPRTRVLQWNRSGQPGSFFWETLDQFPGVAGRVDRSRIVRAVMATGPFASKASRVIADGVMLVGDAADFFDPFTGEGIYSALRGAQMAAACAGEALQYHHVVPARALSGYVTARRRAFAGKWAVERLIGYAMYLPSLFNRAVERLERRGLADTLIGVTGDFIPAGEVLNPVFLGKMVL